MASMRSRGFTGAEVGCGAVGCSSGMVIPMPLGFQPHSAGPASNSARLRSLDLPPFVEPSSTQ
jgi:hypothetical protein